MSSVFLLSRRSSFAKALHSSSVLLVITVEYNPLH